MIKPFGFMKTSKIKILGNLLIISFLAVYMVTIMVIVANFNNVLFAVRRPDMMEAARKVELEENRQIQAKIKEAKSMTLKKILSPIVISAK